MKQLKFISLFTGVGGLDLGLESAGHECVAQVEFDDYCRAVLARHWPDVPRLADVREAGAHNLPAADMVVGGFPCQDISSAGRRAGINENTRSGLWFEFYRIIREVRPRFALIENVEALRHRGRGLDIVLSDLAKSGFNAEWDVLPAASFGAHHLRERIFIFAWDATAPDAGRFGWPDDVRQTLFSRIPRTQSALWEPADLLEPTSIVGVSYPKLPERVRIPHGVSGQLDAPELTPKERRALCKTIPFGAQRMKACGNAVAVPVAAHVGRCIAH